MGTDSHACRYLFNNKDEGSTPTRLSVPRRSDPRRAEQTAICSTPARGNVSRTNASRPPARTNAPRPPARADGRSVGYGVTIDLG